MTDIVARLRADARGGYAQYWRETAAEAAAEIERLRAALQAIADDATPGDDNYCSEIARRALEPKP